VRVREKREEKNERGNKKECALCMNVDERVRKRVRGEIER